MKKSGFRVYYSLVWMGVLVLAAYPLLMGLRVAAATASVLTGLMYGGEMILLRGNLYIMGKGFLFRGLPGIVLAPFDLLVILAAGGLTALVCRALRRK